MKIFMFLIWIMVGVCLFLAGCRATICAADLEASIELRPVGSAAPMVQEVHVGKGSD